MPPVTFGLFLSLATLGAPTPVAQELPKDLIDLLPDDTAAVLSLDAVTLRKSPIGERFLKQLPQAFRDSHFPFEELTKDLERGLFAQFAIDQGSGDFCFLFRLREGETFTPKLLKHAKRNGDRPIIQKIGKYSVYQFERDNNEVTFALVDARTVLLVLAAGIGQAQIQETIQLAYGERKTIGPNQRMRKQLATIKRDEPLVLVADHPKAGHALAFSLLLIGSPLPASRDYNPLVQSFHATVKLGDAAEAEFRITSKDEKTAKELIAKLKNIPPMAGTILTQLTSKTATFEQENDQVLVRFKLTKTAIDGMLKHVEK